MTATEIVERLRGLSREEMAVVRLYEKAHTERAHVLRATEEALAGRADSA
jgi:hypothetical protein